MFPAPSQLQLDEQTDLARRAGEVLGDPQSLQRWHAALAPGTAAVTVPQLLTTLQQLEVASTTIGDETMTGSTIPIELVQLSAQTRNAFARYSLTGDDKLGGWSVKRFARPRPPTTGPVCAPRCPKRTSRRRLKAWH